MTISSKDIGVPFIAGLMTTILSTYLFSIKKINLIALLSILIGSLIVIMIIGIKLKNNEIEDELDIQKTEQKRLIEKLKIHEQLIDIKRDIRELQKNFKDGKKK